VSGPAYCKMLRGPARLSQSFLRVSSQGRPIFKTRRVVLLPECAWGQTILSRLCSSKSFIAHAARNLNERRPSILSGSYTPLPAIEGANTRAVQTGAAINDTIRIRAIAPPINAPIAIILTKFVSFIFRRPNFSTGQSPLWLCVYPSPRGRLAEHIAQTVTAIPVLW